MPQRIFLGLDHISSVPTKTGGKIDVSVKIANKAVLNYWHSAIQPEIRKLNSRADTGWYWPGKVKFFSYTAKALNQEPCCYTIGIKQGERFLPCALVFAAERYYYLRDAKKSAVFIWFMSTAPDVIYNKHGLGQSIPKLGFACIDVGITASYNNSLLGYLGLHASPKDPGLKNFYGNKCGLLNINRNQNLPGIRQNDGRYFYSDVKVALNISRYHDIYR